MPKDLFEDFRHFADHVLNAMEHGDPEARRFRWLLGQINDLLKNTHEIVIQRLDHLAAASDATQASEALKELRTHELEAAFRLEGMCDSFEAMGIALQSLNRRHAGNLGIGQDDLAAGDDVARRLMDREREVASIYTDEVQALAHLLYDLDENDLTALKEQAGRARRLLTDQVADFDAKARRFLGRSR